MAYYLIGKVEAKYKRQQTLKLALATLFPLPNNPNLSDVERKLTGKFAFDRQKV